MERKKSKKFSVQWDRYQSNGGATDSVLILFLLLWGKFPEVNRSSLSLHSLGLRKGDRIGLQVWFEGREFSEEREEYCLEDLKVEGVTELRELDKFEEIGRRYGFFIKLRNEEKIQLQVV